MLDLIIGPSYEDVYSIGRVLLAEVSQKFSQFQTWPFYPNFGLPTSIYQIPVRKRLPDNHSFVTRIFSDFGTGKQGSGPQKLDLDLISAI
jgi:hypothetical protein